MTLWIFSRDIEPIPYEALCGPPIWQVYDLLMDLQSSREKRLNDAEALAAFDIISNQLIDVTPFKARRESIKQLAQNLPCCFTTDI